MEKKIKIASQLLLLLIFICGVFSGSALAAKSDVSYANEKHKKSGQQEVEVSGTVENTQGEALPGVNIVVQGTTIGTTTDVEGEYSIECSSDATLVFSYVGYRKQSISVEGRETIDVILEEDVQRLEEVVAIGYGTAQKRDVSGSISSIQSEDMEDRVMTNTMDMLRGTVAGFSSTTSTGPEGGGSMKIRGQTSIMASSDPLIVIDGTIFRGSVSEINPDDIESINVLKDASAAAVYGASAAAGVVEITTKKGTTDEPTINISTSIGWEEVGIDNKPFSPQGYLEVYQDRMQYDYYEDRPENYFTHPENLPSDMSIEEWRQMDEDPPGEDEEVWLRRIGLSAPEIENVLEGKTIDWYDQVLRKGLRQNYNVSISGARENLSYFTSMQYIDNQGMVVDDRYKTLRGRVNLDYDIADFISVGTNTQFSNTNDGFLGLSITQGIRSSPYADKYDEDGDYIWSGNLDVHSAPNPFLERWRDYDSRKRSLRSNIFGKIDLPAGFAIETRWVNRLAFNRSFYYSPSKHPSSEPVGGEGYRNHSEVWDWQLDNLLTWSDTIADIHQFDFTFLFNVEKNQSWSSGLDNENIVPNENLIYHELAAGLAPSISSNDWVTTGEALMGRINYRLLDRYLLNLSLRRDGFSAFGRKHPYGLFPAASVGWIISDENFFTSEWLTSLKLRASYGVNGNRSIGGYSAIAALSTTRYIYGDNSYAGIYASRMENEDLKWERTKSYNVGIDFGMFNGRMSGSINAYYQSTDDLLLMRSLPMIVGYEEQMTNLGQVDNRGFELELESINLDLREVMQWKSSLTFSLNRNEIVHLYGDEVPVKDEQGNITGYKEASDWDNGWYIGHSLHAIRDYEATHVYGTDEEEEARAYGARPGYFALRDVNNDTTYAPRDDYIFQGKTEPQFRVNLRNSFTLWQNLNISFHIRALLDYKGTANHRRNTSYAGIRTSGYGYPYWTRDNQLDQWQAPLHGSRADVGYNVYEDRSFVKLQNLSIGYTIPESLIGQQSALKDVRVSFSLENGPTWTNWTYWDPETAWATPRIFSFRLNVSL